MPHLILYLKYQFLNIINIVCITHYFSGEDVLISLCGQAQDSNVRLDKNSVRIEGTYISMANQRTITIHNRTDVIAHFRWTQFATQEEEDHQKLRYLEILITLELLLLFIKNNSMSISWTPMLAHFNPELRQYASGVPCPWD